MNIRILNDHLMAADSQLFIILIIFDLSSAFAIISQTTLLSRLSSIGISHLTVLSMLHSLLLSFGVPQGSVLGHSSLPTSLAIFSTNSAMSPTAPQTQLN